MQICSKCGEGGGGGGGRGGEGGATSTVLMFMLYWREQMIGNCTYLYRQ